MTLTRLRTWIGDHPQRAIALVLTAWLALFPLVAILYLGPPRRAGAVVPGWPGEAVAGLAAMVYLLLTPVVLVGWPCYVGCVLARAGLPVERGWNAPMWVFVSASCLAFLCYVAAGIYAGDGWWILAAPLVAVFAGIAPAFFAAFGTMIGLRLAERITGWMIRRGKWEVTHPVAPVDTEKEEVCL